jgi:hypothetical protein
MSNIHFLNYWATFYRIGNKILLKALNQITLCLTWSQVTTNPIDSSSTKGFALRNGYWPKEHISPKVMVYLWFSNAWVMS